MTNGKLPCRNRLLFGMPLIFVLIFAFSYNKNEKSCLVNLYDLDSVFSGDIIFRKGHDLVSRIVLAQRDSSIFSHVGVIVRINSGFEVVHAIPEESSRSGGVIMESLEEFVSCKNSVASSVYRINSLQQNERELFLSFVLNSIGKPFDHKFRYKDNNAFYCTELVIKAIEQVNNTAYQNIITVEIPTLKEPVYLPEDLRKSNLLVKVKDLIYLRE